MTSGDHAPCRRVSPAAGRFLLLSFCLLLGLTQPAWADGIQRLTPEEEAARIERIRARIEALGYDFEVGPTSLTSVPWEVFKERYLGLELPEGWQPRPIVDDHGAGDRDRPARWDWREHGPVPGIRHQGACGSCWCFSAAAAFEMAILRTEGFEVDISEQQGLSCNTGGSGCGGGWMDDAYDVWDGYGAYAEEDFPYEANDGIACPGDTYPAIARIASVHSLGNSVSQIKQAIYDHGAVSTTVMVYDDLVAYRGGCYEHSCSWELNHAIALVGWDDDYCDGQGAWLMQNSWGTDWGIDGYAHMKYGTACLGEYATWVEYVAIANLLGINHVPLADTENTSDPYEMIAEIIATGGSVDLGASYLDYRIDMGSWVQVPLSHVSGDEYVALIPAQSAGTKIDYYLHAEDTVGNEKTVPMWAPDDTYPFVVGTFEQIVFEDFETESGWTVGYEGDDATAGIWEWGDPEHTDSNGRTVQPEDDHTPAPGRYCFVTGAAAGSGAGSYDVDGGRTTLLSPVYDLSEYELVVVDYRRWYTNRRGSDPYEDIWEVSVRSGASGWVPIEYTSTCRENWSYQVHILKDFVDMGPEVQLRFVASDEDGGSLVEALVDDLELRGVRSGTSDLADRTPGQVRERVMLCAAPVPTHSRAEVAFYLPQSGTARVQLLDNGGRLLRVLHAGSAPAGWTRLVWDGRDGRARAVPSGLYHLLVETDQGVATRSLPVLR